MFVISSPVPPIRVSVTSINRNAFQYYVYRLLQWPSWGSGVSTRGCLWQCLPRGCLTRGCLPRGCLLWSVCPGGVCPGGVYPGGVYPGGCITACNGADPLWTEFLTLTCENITFPQLLFRMITIYLKAACEEYEHIGLGLFYM